MATLRLEPYDLSFTYDNKGVLLEYKGFALQADSLAHLTFLLGENFIGQVEGNRIEGTLRLNDNVLDIAGTLDGSDASYSFSGAISGFSVEAETDLMAGTFSGSVGETLFQSDLTPDGFIGSVYSIDWGSFRGGVVDATTVEFVSPSPRNPINVIDITDDQIRFNYNGPTRIVSEADVPIQFSFDVGSPAGIVKDNVNAINSIALDTNIVGLDPSDVTFFESEPTIGALESGYDVIIVDLAGTQLTAGSYFTLSVDFLV